MIIYIVAIVLFIVLDFSNNFRPYHQYILFMAATMVLLSIVYQLIQKRWGKAILYSAFSFSVTIAGFLALMVIGLFIELSGGTLSGGSLTVLNEQHYRDEFESNTKLAFPESAHFIAMDDTLSGFGFENEYDAHCLIKVSRAEYHKVLQQIKSNPDFEEQSKGIDFEAKLVKNFTSKDFSETFLYDNDGHSWYTISFHSDQQTIGIKIATY